MGIKSNYGRALNLSQYIQIFPAEAMTGNSFHDYGVFCAILTASKIMKREDLKKVADRTPPQFRKLIAETCKRIVNEQMGYIGLKIVSTTPTD